MNWSAEQQRLLQAMGYELMAHGTQWPAAAPIAAAAPASARREPTRGHGPAAPAAPGSSDRPTPGGAPTARLLEALRRAAGGGDVSGLVDDLDRLRREPALKRALWPRLRTLRRSH